MLSAFFVAFVVALIATVLTIRSSVRHGHVSGDHDLSGPQKIHGRAVPRIGGVGIFSAFAVATLFLMWQRPEDRGTLLRLLACTLPVFVIGLQEDLTKRVSPRRRLFAAAVSAVMGAFLLDAVIPRTDIPGLDFLASYWWGAVLLAIFVASGVVNAVNIIDGLNGLASMCVALMLSGLAYVAIQAADPLIAVLAIATTGAVLGFFLWNYPNGLIFLGDGGAYFLGFVLAELSILLLHRNPEVSPLFPLLLCAYPVFETLFSMYRRKVVRGRAMGMPDGIHLHSLVYKRLMRWAIGNRDAAVLTQRNSMTAPYLWLVCASTVVPSLFWWDSSAILAICLFVFMALYVLLYSRIVKFKTPRLLVRRRQPRGIVGRLRLRRRAR
jgi:UDP-N-acetylmuramyl pentapeptide phosphotransferase/UDP-N-acetylglucosamine-1-phosphate transferase